MDTLNIVLLDKHQLFREGVKQVLDTEASFHIIVNSDDYSVLNSALDVYSVDVVLLDIQMFMENETHVRNFIKDTETEVIVLSNNGEEAYVTEVIKSGINGYLLKEMDIHSFIKAIKVVMQGASYIHPSASEYLVKDYRKLLEEETGVMAPLHLFSKRECEVLQLLTDGQSNRKIAETLDISEKTVKNHVSSLFKKMKVNGRTQAVVTAIRNHWVELR